MTETQHLTNETMKDIGLGGLGYISAAIMPDSVLATATAVFVCGTAAIRFGMAVRDAIARRKGRRTDDAA
jgi:hypothetical protein